LMLIPELHINRNHLKSTVGIFKSSLRNVCFCREIMYRLHPSWFVQGRDFKDGQEQ